MAQEEKKEISFEEFLRRVNAEMEELSRKVNQLSTDQGHLSPPSQQGHSVPAASSISVERVLLLLLLREIKAVHEHFDWIYPQLKLLLKQDIRAQKRLLRELK